MVAHRVRGAEALQGSHLLAQAIEKLHILDSGVADEGGGALLRRLSGGEEVQGSHLLAQAIDKLQVFLRGRKGSHILAQAASELRVLGGEAAQEGAG